MRLIGKIDGCKQETYKEWQIQQHCRKTLHIFNVGSYYLLIAKNSASLANNFFKKRLHIETTRILLLYIYIGINAKFSIFGKLSFPRQVRPSNCLLVKLWFGKTSCDRMFEYRTYRLYFLLASALLYIYRLA